MTRQLSVDTTMEPHAVGETIADHSAWPQIDVASSFTVYIEHQRNDANESDNGGSLKKIHDFFGVISVELTAQTANHSCNFEPWSSPMILVETSKITDMSFCCLIKNIILTHLQQ